MGILVTVTGRLTREPEQRQTQNGGSYALISVAGNNGYGDQQETYYFGASIYGKRADTVLTNYHKGDLVLLNGQNSEYQGNDGNTYKALRYATVEMLNHRNQPNNGYNNPLLIRHRMPHKAIWTINGEIIKTKGKTPHKRN